ncbi:MAG: ABC transporter ATP-binding protein [Anaerolineaceae bacterium]|nr:ABC transporter ATP-binding protein [Anaerolineaceae bacterium]
MDAIIEVQHLSKRYPSQPKGKYAIEDINLKIYPGEMYGLLGPDGAGKTTTIRILASTMRQSAGEARIGGYDINQHPEKIRQIIGYMPQNFSLYPDLTVHENLDFFADINHVHGNKKREQIQFMLDFTRLADFQKRKAQDLSGGMKKKLALACSLIHEPKILLLDEPSTGVDPVSRRELWLILSRVVQNGVSVLVSTPYMDEAERCARVGILYEGQILTTGAPKELEALLPHHVIEVKGTPRKGMWQVIRANPDILSIRTIGDRLRLTVKKPNRMLRVLRRQLQRGDVTVKLLRETHHNMEDVFIQRVLEREQSGGEPRTPQMGDSQ